MADNNENKNTNRKDKGGFFDKFKSNKKETTPGNKDINNGGENSDKIQNPRKNIKVIMGVYLVLLLGLIGYITYFYLFKAPEINKMPANAITMTKASKVVRGSILDAENQPIAKSERVDAFNQKRIYPYGDLYSAAIGYASTRYGTTGMESIYNTQLTTYDGLSLSEYIKTYGLKKAFANRGKNLAPEKGNSIITTLNTPLQKVAWEALGDNEGAVVAMEPKTGAILAMVSKPTFDPNDLAAEMKQVGADEAIGKPNKSLLNQATHDPTAPGSVFKTVTISSALENIPGIQNRVFDDKGSIKIGNYTLPNENFRAFGEISLARALSVSSNVVFGTIGMELGNTALKSTAEAYGFNKGVPTNGFYTGTSNFPTLQTYDKGSMAQSAIGQGATTATPFQMALVVSTIANGGVMMEPTMVHQIINSRGEVVQNFPPKELKRVISAQNAATITKDMRYVTEQREGEPSGVWDYMNPDYKIASKTGTAQKENAQGQLLVAANAWFVCFAPANNPKIAVAVKVVDGGAGSKIGASIAYKLVKNYLTQVGV
ncbi:penicillin-binding protein 2 [uncultured Clostridium sp.]|jgi:cell division protein FtsI/penicillin-binding protein 2|uniref:peptidoglycan D,D-transpeptidase FtsI family protein n=1 Tax=uncultured Clostridium sp. TaxID=59620 RepID=UPI00260C75C1|nr:penicillin-binding transpeptidase domain-containing protein [uncultured Clostridium sp.]